MSDKKKQPSYEAIAFGTTITETLERLHNTYRANSVKNNHRLYRLLVSALGVTRRAISNAVAMERLLEIAQPFTRKRLDESQASFAVVTVMTGAKNRSTRKRASEYSRAIDKMLALGIKTAKAAFELLSEKGVKRLAGSRSRIGKPSQSTTAETDAVQCTFSCTREILPALIKPEGQWVFLRTSVEHGKGKRARFEFVRLRPQDRPAP